MEIMSTEISVTQFSDNEGEITRLDCQGHQNPDNNSYCGKVNDVIMQ